MFEKKILNKEIAIQHVNPIDPEIMNLYAFYEESSDEEEMPKTGEVKIEFSPIRKGGG